MSGCDGLNWVVLLNYVGSVGDMFGLLSAAEKELWSVMIEWG